MTHPEDFVERNSYGWRDDDYWDEVIAHDFYVRHQNRLDEQDRAFEKAGRSWGHLAYTERPSPRERREHFDENRVRALTHPRTGQVEVQPRRVPIDEAA
jgi:hypothetical protein